MPSLLGAVHRGVGEAEQLERRLGAGADRHADRRADEHLVAGDDERAGERVDDADRDGLDRVEVGRARAEHDELVAAEPGDDVLDADRARDPVGDEHEQLVARVVAEPVVHELEAVEVDEHHADDVVGAAGAVDRVAACGRAACAGSGGR